AHQPQEIGHDGGAEPTASEAQGIESLSLQVSRRGVFGADAHEADLEARGVEPGKPPREQARHAVGAGPADAELVAQVEDPDLFGQGQIHSSRRTRLTVVRMPCEGPWARSMA